MVNLLRYHFSGIGRFVKKQTIDLEKRSHLIQIDGENTNTGGSSGAGKSTTVEALAYLFGISNIPSTQLQSRITKSTIWVQGEFEGDITITRSKKDGLTIETPEGTISGNSKLAEEKLDEIIGINRKLLGPMCYKRQKEGGFFLNLTPKESHSFLVDCLDLTTLKNKSKLLEDKIKDKYKPRKIELESSVFELKKTVEQFNNYLQEKEKPVKPEMVDLEETKTKIQVSEQALDNEEKNYQNSLSQLGPKPEKPECGTFQKQQLLDDTVGSIKALKQEIESNEQEKQKQIDQASQAVNKIKQKIDYASSFKDKMIGVKKEIDKLTSQLEHLSSGNCPTCMREWKDDNFENKIKEINQEIEQKKEEFSNHRQELEQVPHLKIMEEKAESILQNKKNLVVNKEEKESLEKLEENKRLLLNEKENIESTVNQEYLEKYKEWSDKFSGIDNIYKQKKSEIVDQIAKMKHEIEIQENKEKSYQEALKAYESDLKNIQDKTRKFADDLKQNEKELKDNERNIILSEESIRLIKNYTLQKFQDTLDYIGSRATEIINMIPNMANAIISFESAKETKSGKIKNEVNAVINLEGDTEIPIKTLSGGERTSADFAIDLAVGEMIESITKKGVNFLIIDEGFDGLDSISKIECLEILKSLNTEKKILMVDHSSEVKEMVYDIIKVSRVNEESYIYG